MNRTFLAATTAWLFVASTGFVFCACGQHASSSSEVPTVPETQNGGDLHFDASNVQASRYPQGCGVTKPPYAPTDGFSLLLRGPGDTVPYPTMSFLLEAATVPEGTPISLVLDPWQPLNGPTVETPPGVDGGTGSTIIHGNGQGAHSEDRQVLFSMDRGFHQNWPDAARYDSATLTVVHIPKQDGERLAFHILLHFEDGHTLDETYSAVVPPIEYTGCAAG